MNLRRGMARTGAILGLAMGMFAAPALGTILARMSVEQMARAARAVVRARCVRNAAAWDGGEIWTFTTFDIEETWRGTLRGEVRVRLLGGSAGGLTSRVAGVPRFRAGEEVVLFLEATARGDYSVVNWEEGTFRITRDAGSGEEMVTQDTADLATLDPATRRFVAGGIRSLAVGALRVRVTAAAARAEGETQ